MFGEQDSSFSSTALGTENKAGDESAEERWGEMRRFQRESHRKRKNTLKCMSCLSLTMDVRMTGWAQVGDKTGHKEHLEQKFHDQQANKKTIRSLQSTTADAVTFAFLLFGAWCDFSVTLLTV